jgi:hypothetical protein
MATFRVTDTDSLGRILDVFSQLDAFRWSQPANHTTINYCAEDLTAEERLLTHWLCYITDRQTPFERISDVGGYVLSYLVRAYTRRNQNVRELLNEHLRRDTNDGKHQIRFECPIEKPNSRLVRYGFEKDFVPFASRFMPEDVLLIFRTLTLLDRTSQRSLSRFMSVSGLAVADQRDALGSVARALYGLTYISGGARSAEEVDERLDADGERVEGEAQEFAVDSAACLKRWGEKFRPHGKKRLWCSIRDYLKSPELNDVFVQSLKDISFADAGRWHRDSPALRAALDVLELPGDVWNNNEVFRNGLFSPYLSGQGKTWDTPYTVRLVYEQMKKQGAVVFYPEQLDVTFDFVPRMCQRNMCDVCCFGAGISTLCHARQGLLCPIALAACGYRHECRPNDCRLKEDGARGLCHSSTARDHAGSSDAVSRV